MLICKHPTCQFRNQTSNECMKDIVILNEGAACDIFWFWRNGQMSMRDDSERVKDEHHRMWWVDLEEAEENADDAPAIEEEIQDSESDVENPDESGR